MEAAASNSGSKGDVVVVDDDVDVDVVVRDGSSGDQFEHPFLLEVDDGCCCRVIAAVVHASHTKLKDSDDRRKIMLLRHTKKKVKEPRREIFQLSAKLRRCILIRSTAAPCYCIPMVDRWVCT